MTEGAIVTIHHSPPSDIPVSFAGVHCIVDANKHFNRPPVHIFATDESGRIAVYGNRVEEDVAWDGLDASTHE